MFRLHFVYSTNLIAYKKEMEDYSQDTRKKDFQDRFKRWRMGTQCLIELKTAPSLVLPESC